MRTHCTTFALMVASASSAQLLNGSFEDDAGQADLSFWQSVCTLASAPDAAPFSGVWSAEIEASNPQGCFPGWLYQEVPWAEPGMLFFLGGWCRNVGGPWSPQIGVDVGTMSAGGEITPMDQGPTTTDTSWTWLSFIGTIQMGPGEQAVVLCNPGFVGGPAFSLARFDAIDFFPVSLSVEDLPSLHHYHDAANGSLHIASDHERILGVRLLDPVGRLLPSRSIPGTSTTVHLDLHDLPMGLFIAVVRTDRGEGAFRFVIE